MVIKMILTKDRAYLDQEMKKHFSMRSGKDYICEYIEGVRLL